MGKNEQNRSFSQLDRPQSSKDSVDLVVGELGKGSAGYTKQDRLDFIGKMNTRLFGDPETGGKVYIADPDLLKPGANLEDLQGQFLVNIEDEYDPLFPETVAEMNFAAWEHAMLTYMADQNSLGTNDPRVVDPWIATSGAVTVAPDYKRVGFSDPGYVALVKPDDWGETYQSTFGLKKEGPLAVDLSRANMEGEFFYKGGIYHELGHALFPIADAKKALAAQLEDPVFMEHPDLKVAYINNYVERVADTVEALMHLEDSSETAPQIAVFSDIRAYSTFHRQNNHPAEEERHPPAPQYIKYAEYASGRCAKFRQ